MNIVINALSARLGGGQTYLINLLRYLPDDGDLRIFIFVPEGLALPEDSRITRLRTGWPTDNPLLRAVWEKCVLPKILRKLGAHVLFCPGGVLSTRAPDGCRTVTMFRNMIPFDMEVRRRVPFGLQRIRNWLLERVMLNSMASADLVIFISDFARSVIAARITIGNAVTIPHGISESFRCGDSVLARPDFLPAGEYMLYVSRFDVYKHHYEVVSAYASLAPEVRAACRLVLVGESDTACGDAVRALVAARGLGERVHIMGAVPYQLLPAVYRNARLILFASSCENCPNILLEALGAGRPVLSSSVMPMPEFGADAVAYFDPRNAQEIAARISEVIGDPLRADQLARRAARRNADYDWALTARRTWHSISALAPACRGQAGVPPGFE